MTTNNPFELERSPAAASPIEQLIVMHCLKDDSVLGREGFSVRAASPGASDSSTLDWALKLDSYELPLDMKTGSLLVNQAPRRLARVPGPPGRVGLVHTAYLPKDSVGRPHSFISQILLLPEVGTATCTAAWGSSDWQTSEYTRDESKVLPTLDRVPQGSVINESALSAFLAGGPAPADQSLARTIYPSRVESNPEARRKWVRSALHGFLRAIEPNTPRPRVCLFAEPGAVALLVYAIGRLLPPQIAGAIPFSTYEPSHTCLRDNKFARVIGSYARNGFERADFETFRRRGYVVDTFHDTYDPDLLVTPDWPLEGLLKLAADGDWKGVDAIRELWSRDGRIAQGASPGILAEAIRARPLVVALGNGTLAAEGLLELRRNRFGEGILRDEQYRRPAWEAVRKVWSQPAIRTEFRELLGDHLDELMQEVRGRAESGPAGAWREGWQALKDVIPTERRVDEFSKLLVAMERTGASLPAAEREVLLGEWCQAAPAKATLPPRLHWLLNARSADEYQKLVGSSKPNARAAGLATCLALSSPAEWPMAPAFLSELHEDFFHAFIAELPGSEHCTRVHDRLRADKGICTVLVDRLIRLRSKAPEPGVENLLSALGCDQPAWHDYWLKNEGANLVAALERLSDDSPLARRLWANLIARVTLENFASGDESGIGPLVAIRDRFARPLAVEQQERLDGWNAITLAFVNPPPTQPPGAARALASACRAVGAAREELAEQWFRARVITAQKISEAKEKSEKLGRSLLGFYETEESAFAQALKLADEVRNEQVRALCKETLFTTIVSNENSDKFARKFEGKLVETSIRPAPEVDLRQKAPRKAASRKGVGFGRFRLSEQATRYVLAFAGGAASTVLLMIVLSSLLANALSSVSARWQSGGSAQVADAATEEKKELESELRRTLAEVREELRTSKAENANLAIQLSQATKRIENAPSAPGASAGKQVKSGETSTTKQSEDANGAKKPNSTTPSNSEFAKSGSSAAPSAGVTSSDPKTAESPPQASEPGATAEALKTAKADAATTPGLNRLNTAEVRANLNKLILDAPLSEEGIPNARILAEQFGGDPAGTQLTPTEQLVRKILLGLAKHDVPPDINPGKVTGATSIKDLAMKTDFAFVVSGEKDRGALAVLTFRPASKQNSLTVYFLSLAEQRLWTKFASSPGNYVIGSSPKGEYFLLGRMNRGFFGGDACSLIKSAQFYKDNSDKKSTKTLSLFGTSLSIPDDLSMAPAFSDDGKVYAFATSEFGSSGQLPRVTVRATRASADNRKSQELDFSTVLEDLKPDWTLAGVSFSPDAQSLVMSFAGKSFLLVFPLSGSVPQGDPGRNRPTLSKLTGPPSGWAYHSGWTACGDFVPRHDLH